MRKCCEYFTRTIEIVSINSTLTRVNAWLGLLPAALSRYMNTYGNKGYSRLANVSFLDIVIDFQKSNDELHACQILPTFYIFRCRRVRISVEILIYFNDNEHFVMAD